MLGISLTVLFSALAAFAVWSYYINPALKSNVKKDNNAMYIIAVAAVAFILRLILGAVYRGHNTDMSCFIGWSNAVFENGFGKFYTLDMFHDYPPGYMYVLYIVGAIEKLFGFSDGAQYALVKLPASLYLFNPATIVNCSLWGQVDSVYTLFILLMIYFISEKKMIYSYFMFAICIFIKPQAFIFTPILIFGIIENVFIKDFSKEKLLKNLGFGVSAIILNLWGALGKNWEGLSSFTTVIGYVFLIAIVAYSVYVFFKSKNNAKYYFVGALLAFMTYMLSTKMHDRYAFPAMGLLLLAFVSVTDFRNFIMYALVTLSQFFNTAWVLFVYEKSPNDYFRSAPVLIASLINVALMIFVVYLTQKLYAGNELKDTVKEEVKSTKNSKQAYQKNTKSSKTFANTPVKKQAKFTVSEIFPKITRVDVIAMAAIVVVYSCIALYDLGDMHAAETEYMISDAPVTLDLGKDCNISQYKFFLGSYELEDNRNLTITFADSSNNTTDTETLTEGSVFHWEEKTKSVTARYVTLSTNGTELSMKEFALLDSSGNLIEPVSSTPSEGQALFDEQQEVPERSSFRNGTYFDEIYHGRTGYEFVHHLNVYEWTHPPLGKVFISIGIRIFGMCPFGWRIVGTVFGIFMLPLIYLFAKKLLKKSWLAIVTCLLLTFDFMHFAQTRIATIDVYITFFVMLMYYFMYKYYSTSFYDSSFKKGLITLALCGISMGLGIASKWTGIYAGAGLAVLFFITLYKRYSEYRVAVKTPNGETNGISHKFIIDNFKPYMIKTILWCCIFFVIVPLIIYCLAYIPYLQAPNSQGFKTIIDNQSSMLTYHSKTVLGSEHPFSSRWYEWIIMKRPIWYYSGTITSEVKEGISSFGNPLVWWLGIPAFFYMVYLIFKNRDKNALFLVIAYLAQLVSWIPVTRLTFIYHYFPCVPFIVLMLGYSILNIYNEAKNKKAVMYGAFVYAGLAIVLFAMFYPVLSGHPCSVDYVDHFLKWFDSWVLI